MVAASIEAAVGVSAVAQVGAVLVGAAGIVVDEPLRIARAQQY